MDKLMKKTDVKSLEHLLQNLVHAQLNEADLMRIGDRNLIKLFKVSQLTLEYQKFIEIQTQMDLERAE